MRPPHRAKDEKLGVRGPKLISCLRTRRRAASSAGLLCKEISG